MSAALTVIGGLIIKPAVVVIQNEMFAFEPDDIGNSLIILCVFGNNKRHRLISQNHSRRIDKPALIIDASGVLSGTDGNIGRIIFIAVCDAVGFSDKNRVIG